MKTNIFAHGFADNRIVSFGASRKGRVWSHEEARDIHEWVRWAQGIGPSITNESISLDSVMSGFLLPEPAKARPPFVPLAIEWPHELIATLSENRRVVYAGQAFSLMDTELRLQEHRRDGQLAFDIVTPAWRLGFEFVFQENEPPLIRPAGADGYVETINGRIELSAFLTHHGLFVTFENETVLMEQGFLLHPLRERQLFPREAVETGDWSGINIQRESQGPHRDPTTIQHRAVEMLSSEADWEVVLDDDGPGELADIVLMARVGEDLNVLFAHCKYSSRDFAGARIDDLYDVCGQAMKMNRAKSVPELLTRRLWRRETARQEKGTPGLIVGSAELLTTIVREARYRKLRATIAIVQPGVSKAAMSEDMQTLLGGTERFLYETFGMKLRVIASE